MASVGRFSRVIQYVREAQELVRTGAIWFGNGDAAIYFMWGQPSHAFIRQGEEVVEGDAALKSIALSLRDKGAVTWRSKELLQRETLHTSSEDLLHVLEQLQGAGAANPEPEAASPGWNQEGRTYASTLTYSLNSFPLLPSGPSLWADVPVSILHLDVLLSAKRPLLVVLESEQARAAGVVCGRELFDAIYVDAQASLTGREAWDAMFNCTSGSVTSCELDERTARAIPVLWRGRVVFADVDKRWLDAKAFLQFVGACAGDRAVMVATAGRVGVVLYLGGEPVVAYTSLSRRPADRIDEILDLFADAAAGAVTILERRPNDAAETFAVLIRDEAPQPELSGLGAQPETAEAGSRVN